MQLSLSIEEVCAATGLGRTKLYQAIGSGALPAKKLGKRTLILKADLDAFLAGLASYGNPNLGDSKKSDDTLNKNLDFGFAVPVLLSAFTL